MPPPPSHSDAGVPRWVLVAGLATVALCFGVAYHWGSVAEDDNAMVPINEITHRIKLTTRDALDCVKRRDSLYKKRVSAKTLNGTRVAEVNAAEKAYNEANALEQATLDNFTHCQDKTSELEVTAKHEAENARDQILALQSLDQQRRDLTAQIEALKKEDKGMRRNLLLDSLRQARENHLNLLHKLGEDVTLDEAYESELLAQYKPTHSSNITASNLARLINRDNITVEQFIARWSNFTYNASEHPKIFIPANNGPDTNATIERPKYFNREGTAPEVLGTVIGNITAPITTTAFAIKSLTTVAMCAYKHDNANLTFPNRFRRVDSRHRVELLNATVESPLVTFCRQCVSAVAQPAFRLACGKDKPNRLYGSYDFWAARSLIRPTPAAVDAARALYNSLGLAGRNVLGVAFKKSPQLALKCLHQRKPQRHYLWARALSNRSNDTLFEAVPGANRTEQCQPTIPTLFAAIDALRTKFKFDAVVVSVETKAEKEIVQNTEFGGAMQVVAIQPDSGFDDMTELLITSWANHILVNRFSDHSQVLTEMFALRNGIQAKKIHFF